MTGSLQQAARDTDATSFRAQINGVALVILFVFIVGCADYFWRHRHDNDDMFVTVTTMDVDRWEQAMAMHPTNNHARHLADLDTMRDAGLYVDPPGNVYDWAILDEERRTG